MRGEWEGGGIRHLWCPCWPLPKTTARFGEPRAGLPRCLATKKAPGLPSRDLRFLKNRTGE